MKKVTRKDGQSADLIKENIERMKQIFPEACNENGVDFDVLRQLLGDEGVLDEGEEKYGLNWHGKKKARQISLTPSMGTLLPCPEESVNWETTQNLFIEGDNLEVLKLLQKSYANKVKLIYIDPPYNTGKEFVYPDNYQDNLDTYLKYTGQRAAEGFTLTSNTEIGGRKHTNWLNMMYPRLKLSRNLLRDDGVIVISISDQENSNLRKICDEVFGEDNFMGCVVWNSTKSVTNTAIISVGHTYNILYARRFDHFKENRHHFRLAESGEGFSNLDNDIRGPWKADPFQVGGWRPNQQYEIVNPNTGKVYTPNEGCSWKNDYNRFQELVEDGRIVFGSTGEGGPQRKRFLSEAEDRGKVTKTWWDDVGTTTNGTQTVKDLFEGHSVFSNPKPVDLISRLIKLGDHTKGGITLDFFAGSGTTAHAVMRLNAIDGKNRKHISIQLPEITDEKSEAFKAGYSTIAEISKERIRRAAKKIQEENPDYNGDGDLGFKVFKLAQSNIRIWNPDLADLEETLLNHQEHLLEERSEQDLLYELLLKRGVDLAVPIESRDTVGKTIYCIGEGVLFACFSELNGNEVEAVAKEILAWRTELNPESDTHVFFRDSGFKNDDVAKTNMVAILAQSGISHVRSL
ncbi:MAG: site-specific DNA-methyltransferase [Aestuariivita sp.]|nr:site-specific DNA-methyltransferase [Aestuariivita sp.]MCY4202262.1 site-specific DNA-methyltransferase [Aestuariivita sp.]